MNDLVTSADSLSLRLGIMIDPVYKFVSEAPTIPTPPKTSTTLPQQSSSNVPAGFETPMESAVTEPLSPSKIGAWLVIGLLVAAFLPRLGKKGKSA